MSAAENVLAKEEPGLSSVDFVLTMMELLAAKKRSYAMSDIAREMGVSKSRTHRHLRALMRHGYVVQDSETERYAIGTKLLAIGETVRDRFDVLAATQSEIGKLRDETGQTVTVSTLIENEVVVLELLRGKTVVEFGVRPGSTLDFHASAHGLVALAFGPPLLAEKILARPLKAWTASTVTDSEKLKKQIAKVRAQRWATAADQLLVGVNALAVPIFDYRDDWRGTLAIVGATQFIPAKPPNEQIALVSAAAAEASRRLGWRTS